MGGMIGSAFAAAFPEKVRSLTLIDALGFIYSDEEKATEQLRLAMISRLKNNQSAGRNKTRYFSKETAVKARLSVSDLTDRDASLLVDRSLLQKGEEFCWRSDNKLRTLSPYRLTLGQARQLMKDIECPVKLIYATKGLKMIQEYLPLAEQLIKSFSAETLVGGHHIHMEQPIEVAKIIKHFLLDT
jgi:pimeloyl-ACP methyl ester carboxylesterase